MIKNKFILISNNTQDHSMSVIVVILPFAFAALLFPACVIYCCFHNISQSDNSVIYIRILIGVMAVAAAVYILVMMNQVFLS